MLRGNASAVCRHQVMQHHHEGSSAINEVDRQRAHLPQRDLAAEKRAGELHVVEERVARRVDTLELRSTTL